MQILPSRTIEQFPKSRVRHLGSAADHNQDPFLQNCKATVKNYVFFTFSCKLRLLLPKPKWLLQCQKVFMDHQPDLTSDGMGWPKTVYTIFPRSI